MDRLKHMEMGRKIDAAKERKKALRKLNEQTKQGKKENTDKNKLHMIKSERH